MPGCRRQGHAVGAGRQDQAGSEPAAGHTVRRCVSDESQLPLHCHCHQHLRPRPRLLGILWSQRSLALFAIYKSRTWRSRFKQSLAKVESRWHSRQVTPRSQLEASRTCYDDVSIVLCANVYWNLASNTCTLTSPCLKSYTALNWWWTRLFDYGCAEKSD